MISSNTKIIGNYTLFTDQMIGGGCFGEIYLGCKTTNSEEKVAIKKVSIKKLSSNDFLTYIENEKNIFISIGSHPNIVTYYDSVILEDCFYLIIEYCPLSLSGFASKFPNKCIPEYQALTIAKDLALALKDLNSKKIIHRNLYPSNILFKDGIVKICSFSFALKSENICEMPGLASSVGIPLFEAPEIYYKQPYSFKCDVWSLGLVLYQMLYGKMPWVGKGLADLFNQINNNALVFPIEPQVSESIKDLIKEMLAVDEVKRCNWQRVLEGTMRNED